MSFIGSRQADKTVNLQIDLLNHIYALQDPFTTGGDQLTIQKYSLLRISNRKIRFNCHQKHLDQERVARGARAQEWPPRQANQRLPAS